MTIDDRPAGRTDCNHDFAAFCVRENGSIDEFSPALSYPGGVALYRQGDGAEEVFYLKHGLVKLLQLHPDGAEVIVGLRSAGWFLAASAAVLEQPYSVTAVTVTPCRLSRLRASSFRHLLKSNPAVSWRVHRMHCEEVLTQLERIADSATLTARERLRKLLSNLALEAGDAVGNGCICLDVPLKQWEMAGLIGVTPQYLCQLIHEMERDGLVRRPSSTS